MNFNPIFPLNVDSTMVSAFRSCPRKFFNEFILGLRPPGMSVDLHAGGCFATAIESVRKLIHVHGISFDEAMLRTRMAFEIAWGNVQVPDKKANKGPDRVWVAVEEYFKSFPPLTDHIQPFIKPDGTPTIEFTFAIPLDTEDGFPAHPVSGEPILYSGRLDLLGHMRGLMVAEDDKTGSTGFYAGWSEKWDLRSQFIGYTWALQQLGYPCENIAVRGIGILKEKIHIAEVIKPYSNFLRERWYTQLRRDLNRMVKCWNEGYWDYDLGEACVAYGNCIFNQACQSPNEEMWLGNFEVRRWNPLNADPTKT